MARLNKWDTKHLKNGEHYARQIEAIYRAAVREAAAIGASTPDFSPDKPFSFADYPSTKARMDKLTKTLKSSVTTVILDGIDTEWSLANDKNSELCDTVFGKYAGKLTKEQQRRYYSTNNAARKAFTQRKTAGLNLSDRVWRYTDQFKAEIEMGIDLGLRDGVSADEMSRQLRQYLRQPDKLFRRVRDEHGQLHLSKQAAAYHPGAGVYRSSYKNARRLAATETNLAYRTSDYTRWQQLDFVVGIEIKLSNNHTLGGMPFTDICDQLAGRYPKDFRFTGWHPHCRCHAVSILKTQEEMAADNERIMNGEPLDGESVNKVSDVPDNFKSWISDNEERISRAKSLPCFLRDNERYTRSHLEKSGWESCVHKTFAEDAYSQALKDKAVWCKSTSASMSEFKGKADEVYEAASQAEIDAAYNYTSDSGYFNRPLRGYDRCWGKPYFKGINRVPWDNERMRGAKDIENLTKMIGRSSFDKDVWLQREMDNEGLALFLQLDKLSAKAVKALVGQTFTDSAFVSCAAAKMKDFGTSILNIYCPKGTKMLYIDGRSAFMDENEMLLQRNTRFRVTKVEKAGYRYYIDLEVTGQI